MAVGHPRRVPPSTPTAGRSGGTRASTGRASGSSATPTTAGTRRAPRRGQSSASSRFGGHRRCARTPPTRAPPRTARASRWRARVLHPHRVRPALAVGARYQQAPPPSSVTVGFSRLRTSSCTARAPTAAGRPPPRSGALLRGSVSSSRRRRARSVFMANSSRTRPYSPVLAVFVLAPGAGGDIRVLFTSHFLHTAHHLRSMSTIIQPLARRLDAVRSSQAVSSPAQAALARHNALDAERPRWSWP